MIIILSPAKTLDYDTPFESEESTLPVHLEKAEKLVFQLRKLKPRQLAKLMNISNDLAELNFQRYQAWNMVDHHKLGRQAIFTFKGDVYMGMDAFSFTAKDIEFANQHLRILSGLYGILKPTDLILPYRLEMGTNIKIGKAKDLYAYWKPSITDDINQTLEAGNSNVLINLASVEYAKSIAVKKTGAKVITPAFKDYKNGEYKIISFFAKKARGMMASFIIRNKIIDYHQLKAFSQDGYNFNNTMSTEENPVFTRD